MPLYTITRDVDGLSDGDIHAAGVRAMICAFEYSGLKWIRSYLDRDRNEMLCLYVAENVEQLREHALRARIPAGEIREVEEIVPDPLLVAAGPRQS